MAKPVARSGCPVDELWEEKSSILSRHREVGPETWARGTGLDVPGLRSPTFDLIASGEAGGGEPSQSQAPGAQFHRSGEVVRHPCEARIGWVGGDWDMVDSPWGASIYTGTSLRGDGTS